MALSLFAAVAAIYLHSDQPEQLRSGAPNTAHSRDAGVFEQAKAKLNRTLISAGNARESFEDDVVRTLAKQRERSESLVLTLDTAFALTPQLVNTE